MTYLITPGEAQIAVQARRPYALVSDFKDVLSRSLIERYSEDTKAIDALDLPIEKTTTFPYWVIAYLYSNKNTHIEESDLVVAAIQAGYRASDIRAIKKFLEDTQANVGVWYDTKDKKVYYCWYQPNSFTKKNQECLDRGDDW